MLLKAKNLVDEKIIELRERVEKLEVKPKLVIIRVGDDPASEKYVNNKIKKCHETNMLSEIIHFDKDVESSKVEEKIIELNNDDTVTGMLLQLPLPAHLDEDLLTQMIDEKKDVDGFTISNIGRLTLGLDSNIACTPKGIISLLKYYNIPMEGQNVLVINRSNIVGKPLALLFLRENATVTIAHSRTKDLEAKIKNSDIVVTAVGRAAMFNADNFTPGTTIIDVSINFKDGKICGDVDKTSYDELLEKSCNITPVPGGVGPMTVLSLIEQTVEIQEKKYI